jgi:hypothetical protein
LQDEIANVTIENEQLKYKLNNAIAYNASTINRELTATNKKLEKTTVRLFDAIESIIDKMLRQTIAQKTHRERNQDIRRWCAELLQILRIADDDNEPFEPPF